MNDKQTYGIDTKLPEAIAEGSSNIAEQLSSVLMGEIYSTLSPNTHHLKELLPPIHSNDCRYPYLIVRSDGQGTVSVRGLYGSQHKDERIFEIEMNSEDISVKAGSEKTHNSRQVSLENWVAELVDMARGNTRVSTVVFPYSELEVTTAILRQLPGVVRAYVADQRTRVAQLEESLSNLNPV